MWIIEPTNQRLTLNKEIMEKINKYWDWNSVAIPEDFYDIEAELEHIIGEQIMLEENFIDASKKMLDDLFIEIEHGEQDHRDWLKDKINDFKSRL